MKLSYEEKLTLDLGALVHKYLAQVPFAKLDQADTFNITSILFDSFNELVGQAVLEKIINKSKNEKLTINESRHLRRMLVSIIKENLTLKQDKIPLLIHQL